MCPTRTKLALPVLNSDCLLSEFLKQCELINLELRKSSYCCSSGKLLASPIRNYKAFFPFSEPVVGTVVIVVNLTVTKMHNLGICIWLKVLNIKFQGLCNYVSSSMTMRGLINMVSHALGIEICSVR